MYIFVIITNWTSEGLQKIKQELLISKRKKKNRHQSILGDLKSALCTYYFSQHFQSLTFTVNIILAAFFYPNTKFIYADALPDFKAVKQSAYKLQAVFANRG